MAYQNKTRLDGCFLEIRKKIIMRCEGWRRYGGAFTFGPPVWKQCENNAMVILTVVQEEQQEMPACMKCWNEAKEKAISILKAEPIAEKPQKKSKKKTITIE